MVGHPHAIPLEVVGTMIEMAEVAYNALEHRRDSKSAAAEEEEASRLRSENERLKAALAQNLAVLQKVSEIPSVRDCPDDLYARIEAAVDSTNFLMKLESLQHDSDVMPSSTCPFPEGSDPKEVDVSVIGEHAEPSWWVWVTKDVTPVDSEEVSGIDKENYVVVTDDNVVDGIAEFIAKCIYENPKSKVLTPEQLQKTVLKALGGIKDKSKLRYVWETGKIAYTLSTWGLALAGLYRGRAVIKAAAVGVGTASRFVAMAL